MLQQCYKCGVIRQDDYPSHFCEKCRGALFVESTPETAIRFLAERLTPSDKQFLKGMKIRLDRDMIKENYGTGLGPS